MEPSPEPAGDPMLGAFLADRDIACPGCGYNLRGLTGRTCPECAQGLRLAVNLDEPRLGLWIAGLVGSAAAAGFNGLLMVYAIIRIAAQGRGDRFFDTFVLYNAIGLMIQGVVLALWIRMGRAFRRKSAVWKWVLVLFAWALAAVDLAGFSMLIR